MMYGDEAIGGLWWANNHAKRAIELSLISDNPSDGSPAGENDGIASGTFKIDDNDDFSFRLDDLSAAPTGMVYALWASNTDEGRFTSLGVIPAGELVVEGLAPGDLFSEYTQVQLSLEPESNSPPESPGRVFLSGDLSPAAKDSFLEITTPPSIAPLAKAEEQAGIASEHITFLFEAAAPSAFQGGWLLWLAP